MKRAIAFIILTVMIVSVFTGCGSTAQNTNTNNQPENTQANSEAVVTQSVTQAPTTAVQNSIIETEPASQAATTVNNAVLSDLSIVGSSNTKSWGYYAESDTFTLKVEAFYCVDTDVVQCLTYITNCKETKADYAERLEEDKAIQTEITALNDPNITVLLTEDEDGYMFRVNIDKLHLADREQRVNAAVKYIGITPDAATTAFYCQPLEAELKSYGFT